MASLSSSSTLAEVKAAYADNASYAEDGSLAKAQAFATACRILLLKLPKQTKSGESELELDVRLIKEELDAAVSWLAARGASGGTAGGSVKAFSFENLR